MNRSVRSSPVRIHWSAWPAALMVAVAFLAPASALAQFDALDKLAPKKKTFGDSRDHVRISALPGRKQVPAGGDLPVAIIFDQDKNWHIHTNEPIVPNELGGPGSMIATEIKATVESDSGLTVRSDAIQWPKVETIQVNFGSKPVDYGVFGGRAIAYVPVTIGKDAKPGTTTVRFLVSFQACDDATCLPPADVEVSATFEIIDDAAAQGADVGLIDHADLQGFSAKAWDLSRHALSVTPSSQGNTAPPQTPAIAPASAPVNFGAFGLNFTLDPSTFGGLILLLLVAAVGGLALNFMPCVLPVIPIKILSLTKSAGTRAKALFLGAMMSLGVIVFWLALGVIVALLRVFDGPSEIFSYPASNIAIGLFIAIMGLGMFGLFSARLPNWVYNFSPRHDSAVGSFGFGVLTAVLATPCTAPFMGTALGWAVKQPAAVSLAVFGAIGAGMAIPYLVLAAYPKLVDKLPRTGPANELLKQVMGLLMLAAGAYFLFIGVATLLATPGEQISQLYWLPVMLLLAAAGFWMALQIARIQKWPVGPILFTALGLALFSIGLRGAANVAFPPQKTAALDANGQPMVRNVSNDSTHIDWRLYTPQRMEEFRREKKVLVVDFTAEWCINCKVLEATVLHTSTIASMLREADVVPVKVDLTVRAGNPGWKYLNDEGYTGPPLLLVIAPNGATVFKSNAYTVGEVAQAIRTARGPTPAAMK